MHITKNAESVEAARRQVRDLQSLGRSTAERLRDDLVEFYRANGGERDRGRDGGSKGHSHRLSHTATTAN